IKFVTTDIDAQPTPENTRPIQEGDREGQGSIVFFNQATITSDFTGIAQEMFRCTEFFHSYHY
ncbi:hypothetical protein B0H10DRAFT_2114478, partial [Mycena sp. CBHHK59/15]